MVFNNEGNRFSPGESHLTSDKFYHIVATFDGLYLRIYENGDLVGRNKVQWHLCAQS